MYTEKKTVNKTIQYIALGNTQYFVNSLILFYPIIKIYDGVLWSPNYLCIYIAHGFGFLTRGPTEPAANWEQLGLLWWQISELF